MSEQSAGFGDLLEALSMLGEALGRNANLQTMTSRSLSDPDLSVQVFLRNQRHVPIITLVPYQNAERAAKTTSNHLVYIANRVSPDRSLAWRNKGQSFIDLNGHVFLEIPGLLLDKDVRRRRLARQARSKSVDPFADRASIISRYLLNHPPGQSWGVRELAAITRVSLGTTSKILRALEERDLVVVTRQGRNAAVSVEKPRLLFKSWAAVYDWSRNLTLAVQAPIGDAKEFVRSLPRRLGSAPTKWALTLHAGADLIAPHATWNQVHMYVDVDKTIRLERFAAEFNWTPAPDGRLILMRPFYRQSLWSGVQKKAAIPVVDDLQLALDLWNYPLRGREQADPILLRRLHWILDNGD